MKGRRLVSGELPLRHGNGLWFYDEPVETLPRLEELKEGTDAYIVAKYLKETRGRKKPKEITNNGIDVPNIHMTLKRLGETKYVKRYDDSSYEYIGA